MKQFEHCKTCGQYDIGQTGEYPCEECGLPLTWDDEVSSMDLGGGFEITRCSSDEYNIYTRKGVAVVLTPADIHKMAWFASVLPNKAAE
jgi:hypothetical protein